MAEYYEGTRRYRRYRRPFKLKKWMFAVLFLAVGVGIFAYYRGRMSDLLYGLSEAETDARTTQNACELFGLESAGKGISL